MNSIIYIVITGFITALSVWLFHIYESTQWIREQRGLKSYEGESSVRTYLLIPVLDEAHIITKTVSYFASHFLSDEVRLFLVTTEKEGDYLAERKKKFKRKIRSIQNADHLIDFVRETFAYSLDRSETDDVEKAAFNIVDKYANTINLASRLSKKYDSVEHVHFPHKGGKMAHQLNYALEQIKEKHKLTPNSLIGVYNADSRPEPESLAWICHKYEQSEASVFQQYGSYLQSKPEGGNLSFENLVTSAGRWWQTRWSVGFEINHALHQFNRKSKILYPMNYCIGHGLFMSMKVYQKVGGFEERTFNEDAILGLQLSYNQEKIMPVPYFDRSDAPNSIRGLFYQQMNWYMGPLQSFRYFSLLKNESRESNTFLFLLSLKLFTHGVYWIAGPAFMLFIVLVPIVQGELVLLLVSLLVAYMYLITPVIWIRKIVSDLLGQKFRFRFGLLGFIGMLVFYVLHSAAGTSSLVRYIYSKLKGVQINKGTTQMD